MSLWCSEKGTRERVIVLRTLLWLVRGTRALAQRHPTQKSLTIPAVQRQIKRGDTEVPQQRGRGWYAACGALRPGVPLISASVCLHSFCSRGGVCRSGRLSSSLGLSHGSLREVQAFRFLIPSVAMSMATASFYLTGSGRTRPQAMVTDTATKAMTATGACRMVTVATVDGSIIIMATTTDSPKPAPDSV